MSQHYSQCLVSQQASTGNQSRILTDPNASAPVPSGSWLLLICGDTGRVEPDLARNSSGSTSSNQTALSFNGSVSNRAKSFECYIYQNSVILSYYNKLFVTILGQFFPSTLLLSWSSIEPLILLNLVSMNLYCFSARVHCHYYSCIIFSANPVRRSEELCGDPHALLKCWHE